MNSKELSFKLLKELNDLGIDAYLIGGSSRDYLLNNDFVDIDICTKATPDIIQYNLKKYNLVSKDGLYYGVLKYFIDNKEVEITTLRKEGPYIKNRRPSKVEFINDLEEDSIRRDFTINALYIDYEGNVYDYHNGLGDLKNKVVKMIGNPLKRVQEDALRILRTIRLSEKLKFKIDDNLKEIILNYYNLVYSLNKNTLKKEIDKFLEFKRIDEIKEILLKYKIELEKLYEY